jgi:hypothetical protein
MASTATRADGGLAERGGGDVSRTRLWVLRAAYLLLVVGIGAMIGPEILSHEVTSRGVIASLLAAVWVLALFGLKYPLQMLPVLLFEFAWKLIWALAYGLPQWLAGRYPPTFGLILMPLVIPWGYVWRRYVRQPAER